MIHKHLYSESQYFVFYNLVFWTTTNETLKINHFKSCVITATTSHVCVPHRFWLFVSPCTVTRQAPLTMGLSRQKYWSGLPSPPPGDLPDSGIEPAFPESPVPAGRFFTWESLYPLSNGTCEILWNAETSRLPQWLRGKESACQCRRRGFHPKVGKIPWRRKWQPTPVFLPGESHGQRSPAG